MSKNVKSQSVGSKTLLGAQIRAARALLRWSAADLVRESGVSHATIHRAETLNGKTAMTLANATAIRRALEAAGAELLDENGGGPGARFRKRVSIDLRINGHCLPAVNLPPDRNCSDRQNKRAKQPRREVGAAMRVLQ